MVKVLITGFRHSGTTMLHQLIKAHPQVGWIENEESFIEFDKPKEWMLMFARKTAGNLKQNIWGEKIPWGTRDTDLKGARAIGFINKWLKYFKNDARVLHILRHPIDVCLSGRNGNNVGSKDLAFLLGSVPEVIKRVNKDERCATIVYEDLLLDPKPHLENIFKFLKIKVTKKIIDDVINTQLKFGKINKDRAFAYKKKNVNIEVDYDEFINLAKLKL